jgi:hypothetical protein
MIALILTLVLLGVILWAVETYIPMAPPIKMLIRVVVVIFVVLWLIRMFGVADMPIPQVPR